MFGHYENEKKAAGVKTTTTTTRRRRRRSRSTQMRQKDVWQDGYKLRYEKNITLCYTNAHYVYITLMALWHRRCAKLYNKIHGGDIGLVRWGN